MRRLLPRRLAPGEEATLVEHLGELRARLIFALASVGVGFAIVFPVHERVISVLARPLPGDRQLVTFGVTEPLTTSLKVSFIAALALALPVILYQLWAFLAPAMEHRTQRVLSGFVAFATGLFAAGVAFGYFIVLPKAISFLVNYDAELYEIQIRASYYYSFVAWSLLGLGIIFELPIFILALVRIQVLSAERLRKNRRVAIFLAFVVAVLLPTIDPVSLMFEVVPILILFEFSIWLAAIMEKRWARQGVLWATQE